MKKYLCLLLSVSAVAKFQISVSQTYATKYEESVYRPANIQYGFGFSEVVELDDMPITGVDLNILAKYTNNLYGIQNYDNATAQLSLSSTLMLPMKKDYYFLAGPTVLVNDALEEAQVTIGTRLGIRYALTDAKGFYVFSDMCEKEASVGISVFC